MDNLFDTTAWWLIAAVALFSAGWFVARIDITLLQREARALPKSYFEALHHLLKQEPKEAIHDLHAVVQAQPDNTELQFALGSLFRGQGDVTRATRIHQTLLERPNLTLQVHTQARYELALDYHAAGLLDRAEELFDKLQGTSYEAEATRHLIQIYEQEKDWTKAIKATIAMGRLSKRTFHKEIAHYHCALAEESIIKGDLATAQLELDAALVEYKRCTRVNMIRGDMLLKAGDTALAIQSWQAIEKQDARFLSLVASRLLKAYQATGQIDQAIALLTHYQASYPSADLLNAAYEAHVAKGDKTGALALLRTSLSEQASLLALDKFLGSHATSLPEAVAQDAQLMRDVVRGHTVQVGYYRCTGCGFDAKTYNWQCPGCLRWESYNPIRTE